MGVRGAKWGEVGVHPSKGTTTPLEVMRADPGAAPLKNNKANRGVRAASECLFKPVCFFFFFALNVKIHIIIATFSRLISSSFCLFFSIRVTFPHRGSEKKLQAGPATQGNVHDYLFHAPRGRGRGAAVSPRRAQPTAVRHRGPFKCTGAARGALGEVSCWPPCGRRRAVARRDRWVSVT